jgi:hypothetical protein
VVRTKQQCRYAIVRFMPHVETGEFANVGVVLIAPKVSFFGFRVETKRHARVTNFFDTLEPQFYRNAVRALVQELGRVKKMLPRANDGYSRMDFGLGDPVTQLFLEITRDREGLINFSDSRILLSEDPQQALDKLFGHYVDRNFVTPRYRETILEERMKKWLNDFDLVARFSRRQFDDGVYKASFPFVETDEGGRATKIIKPFFLGQKEPTAIIDHGVKWVTSVDRLRTAGLLPSKVLFAVEGPSAGTPNIRAFQETVDRLKEAKIDMIPFEQRSAILDYASS